MKFIPLSYAATKPHPLRRSACRPVVRSTDWGIGRDILDRQAQEGYGTKVIDRLSADLKVRFPKTKGYSPRNLKYMRAFAEAWPDPEVVQRSVAQLPWRHQIALLEKLKTADQRLWYAAEAITNGWSRDILALQIDRRLHDRAGNAITNFALTMPPEDSDLAQQAFKDPYVFDFLDLTERSRERELESGLVDHVREFLLELGQGFAFVGRQVRLEVGGDEFYCDLLFYHLKLRRFVVIELKAVRFEPGFLGQLGMYMSAVDDLLAHPDDEPTIGLLLCQGQEQHRRGVGRARLQDADRGRRLDHRTDHGAARGTELQPAEHRRAGSRIVRPAGHRRGSIARNA